MRQNGCSNENHLCCGITNVIFFLISQNKEILHCFGGKTASTELCWANLCMPSEGEPRPPHKESWRDVRSSMSTTESPRIARPVTVLSRPNYSHAS